MKTMIIVSELGAARWIELPEVIVVAAEWLEANFGPRPADGGKRQEAAMPERPATEVRTPLYWLRQRGGEIDTVQLNAAEAEMIAQRPGAKGDHLRPAGLVWREPDPHARGGYAFYTLTPVFEEPR